MAERKVRVTIDIPESYLLGSYLWIADCGMGFPSKPISVEPIPQPKSKRQEMLEELETKSQWWNETQRVMLSEIIKKLWPEE